MYPMTPAQLTEFILRSAHLFAESQIVISLRLMGLAGVLPARPDELHRMVAEKGPAFLIAVSKAQTAALSGQSPHEITLAAMKPLTRKVRGNRRRLSRQR